MAVTERQSSSGRAWSQKERKTQEWPGRAVGWGSGGDQGEKQCLGVPTGSVRAQERANRHEC